MNRFLVFAVPFGAIVAIGALAYGWTHPSLFGAGPCEPVDVTFERLNAQRGCVRLHGTAHYPSVITQTVPASLLDEGGTWYLFGFFEVNDNANRAIPVLVRTRREPERLVAYETMTVEGRLSVPSKHTVPPQTETVLSKRTGYFFGDDVLVLEATRILSEDGVWVEAEGVTQGASTP